MAYELVWLNENSIQIWVTEIDLAIRAVLKKAGNMEKYGSFNLRQHNSLLS